MLDCVGPSVCGVLSLLPQADATARLCMEQVLQVGATAVSAEVAASSQRALKLLVALADQAPVPYAQLQLALPQWLPQLVATVLQQGVALNADGAAEGVSLLMELVVVTAMSTSIAAAYQESPQSKYLGRASLQRTTLSNDDEPLEAGVLSELGVSCLLPLLNVMLSRKNEAAMELLLQASESTPFLFSNPSVWNAALQTCLQRITSATPTLESQDDLFARLQALQVVTNLLQVGILQRRLLNETTRDTMCDAGVGLLMHVLCSGDESSDIGDDDDDQLRSFATDLVEQLVHALPHPTMEYVLQHVERNLVQAHQQALYIWQQRQGALAALQCCLEAAPARFAQHARVATEAAITYSAHSMPPSVQYQAIQLLGALCENRRSGRDDNTMGSEWFEDHAARILQSFAQATHSPSTKISALASSAIVAYCRPSSGEPIDAERYVVPYLADVLSALVAGPLSLQVEDTSSVDAKVSAIGAIACLAEAAEEALVPFYSHVMPGLWSIVNRSGKETYDRSRLRGAAIEAATIVGLSIGEDNVQLFSHDAERIMNLAVSVLDVSAESDAVAGVPLDQLLSGCARIAAVMKEKYAPYLDSVFSFLLLRATDTSGDFEVSECVEAQASGLEYDEDAGTENMTVTIPGRGLSKITINTSKIQEKAQATRAICQHALALGAAFGPYAKTTLDSFLILVAFKFSSEIRATASQTLAAAYEAACEYGESVGMSIASEYLPLTAKALARQIVDEDNDMEVKFVLAESISQVFSSVYCRHGNYGLELLRCFTADDAAFITKLCVNAVTACLERRAKFTSMLSESLLEDELLEYREMLAKEDEMLIPLTDAIGYIFKLLREAFVSVFECVVAPVLGPYLRSGNDSSARIAAVCLFDDCVEFCGPTAAEKFAPILIEGAISGLEDSSNMGNMRLKRASIYGIAQIARHAPGFSLQPYAQRIMPSLLAIVTKSKDDFDDEPAVFENAVSALGSLVLFGSAPFGGYVQRDAVLKAFLSNMPLREDCDEARVCSSGFCELVEKGIVSFTTECDSVLRIIGDTLALFDEEEDAASPETVMRFVGILFRMQQTLTGDVMNQSFGKLSSEARDAVIANMSRYGHMFSHVITPEK
jgi:hypothetical protein